VPRATQFPRVSLTAAELVAHLGPHPATRAGIDPGADADTARWLLLALLLGARIDEERALAALRHFEERGLDDVASAAALLERARVPRPESVAATAVRACRALAERWQGSLAKLVSSGDDLDAVGADLVALAPGLGRATALRVLRPLRDRFAVAREVPLAPAARAAAVHLGWLAEGDDEEGEPASLRARVANDADAPSFADVEAALERLGTAACLRGRVETCPLGDACPLRGGSLT
jgi:hypothetical protein